MNVEKGRQSCEIWREFTSQREREGERESSGKEEREGELERTSIFPKVDFQEK